ncbi:cuticle protein 10.9-like [Stegodyphus dumicola]|uniref:cuticle protein 10.9-like n=1 Tax=Stegodyphus dumicola TaxID=202533 RepID=UPI0015B15D23|nr:cuticle protein 10.9-like [Stegodyphus dumicola]
MIFQVIFAILAVSTICSAGPVGPEAVNASSKPEKIPAEFPKPYEFFYQMDDGNGTRQHREEIASEAGAVKGKYGYVDPNGIYREVEYNADENGYRAKISSNEPGITHQNSAHVVYVVQAKPTS